MFAKLCALLVGKPKTVAPELPAKPKVVKKKPAVKKATVKTPVKKTVKKTIVKKK